MWLCPTPCSALRYRNRNLPSVLDVSHSKPERESGGGESGQTIRGLVRGYYLSGHGSLHIFHGCSQGVFSQLLVHCIHFGHLWVTCGLHKALSQLKDKWNTKQERWELKGHQDKQAVLLHLAHRIHTGCLPASFSHTLSDGLLSYQPKRKQKQNIYFSLLRKVIRRKKKMKTRSSLPDNIYVTLYFFEL